VTGGAAPTGMVGNESNDFMIGAAGNLNPADFLFATEDGTILGWSSQMTRATAAIVVVDNSALGADYKGLAIVTTGGPSRLYATNFASGAVDVFGPDFTPVTTLDADAFVDPAMPDGYLPFGIQAINGDLFVTFAAPGAGGVDEATGAGLGHVAEFDRDGVFIDTVASGGRLNAPWGIVRAPSSFGQFGGDLLIGNFGDGRITAIDTKTMSEDGQLSSSTGKPIAIDGLWGLVFGNGKQAGQKGDLYFTAGPAGETEGLFGRITPK